MTANSHFQRRLSQQASGCFKCIACGKKTRETGTSNSSVQMCGYCFEESGQYNCLQDGVIDQAEYDRIVAALKIKYHR